VGVGTRAKVQISARSALAPSAVLDGFVCRQVYSWGSLWPADCVRPPRIAQRHEGSRDDDKL